MAEVKCPTCGTVIPLPPAPPRKGGLGWALGCLVAVCAVPVIFMVVGLVAAIAIPAVVSARGAAQHQVCVNNMRQIDVAKQQLAAERDLKAGDRVPAQEVLANVEKSGHPLKCPLGGHYTVNPVGVEPSCSAHGNLSSRYDRQAMRLRPARLKPTAEPEVEK
jgi:hypothetical protein